MHIASDTNRPVQSHKQARGLKVLIYVDEGLYYLSSENKDADQLSECAIIARTADLRLCFRICRYDDNTLTF